MNKLSTRHLRMMNASRTLREIARLFQPRMPRFLLASKSLISLPSFSLSLSLLPQRIEIYLNNNLVQHGCVSSHLKFPSSSYSLALELIPYNFYPDRAYVEKGYNARRCNRASVLEEENVREEGIASGGRTLSTLHGVRLMLPRSYSRGVVPLLANNNAR